MQNLSSGEEALLALRDETPCYSYLSASTFCPRELPPEGVDILGILIETGRCWKGTLFSVSLLKGLSVNVKPGGGLSLLGAGSEKLTVLPHLPSASAPGKQGPVLQGAHTHSIHTHTYTCIYIYTNIHTQACTLLKLSAPLSPFLSLLHKSIGYTPGYIW